MNKAFKLSLFIVGGIFLSGLTHKNSEIRDLIKDGMGLTICTVGILIAIMTIFAWAVEWRDKAICVFWAAAIFSLGWGIDEGGFSTGIMYLGLFLLFGCFWLFGFMTNEFAVKLMITGGVLAALGYSLFIFADSHKSLAFLNRATEQDRLGRLEDFETNKVEVAVDESMCDPNTHTYIKGQCWYITIRASEAPASMPTPEGSIFSYDMGLTIANSKQEATSNAIEMFNKKLKYSPEMLPRNIREIILTFSP